MTCRAALSLGLLTFAALQATCMPVCADEASGGSPPVRYRRVLVPQESLSQRTRGYLPIEREKFQALLADIAQRHRAVPAGAVWIESAEYRATYAGGPEGQLVSGLARLQITHTAAEPVALSLAPWGLAAGEGTWQAGAASRPATIGSDAAGNLAVMVPESGTLCVPWTLCGTTDPWGACRFDMALAAAPLSRIILDVPSDFEVRVDHGLVTPPASTMDASAGGPASAGLRPWVVELGGQSRCALTVAPGQPNHRRRQLVNVQQDTTYRLTDNGLEIVCGIGLEIQREPLAELRLDVDAEVQVTAVRLGNVDVDWGAVPSDDGRGQTVRVQFAERLTGVHAPLQVSGLAPLHTGTLWRLPAFRPQGVLWRQGTMSIIVPETLELRHLSTHNARQSAISTLGQDGAAEQSVFELFGADGALDVNLARRARGIVAELGTTIDLDSGAVAAQTLADLHCRFGECFVVEADIPNRWTIDGIDAEPADALYDYQVVAYEAEHRRVQIQLGRPLTAQAPLRLKVRAHRLPTFPLTAQDLRPVEFVGASYARRLVAVAPGANYRLELAGDSGVQREDPGRLAPADAGRVTARAGSLLFEDDDRARALRVDLSREDPQYAAAVYVDVAAHVDADTNMLSCVESYRIVCTPESTPVPQLQVHLSEPRRADLAWQFVGDSNAVLAVRRVSGEQLASGRPRAGETWQINLRRPQATPFEIRGQRTTRADEPSATHGPAAKTGDDQDGLTVSLATLPAAVSHEGLLTIRSMDGTHLSVTASRVKPIPSVPSPPGDCPTSRACYRFDASRNANVSIRPVRSFRDGASLWVWSCQMASQYLATGEAIHAATFLMESNGGTDLRVRLPEGCTFQGVAVNGAEVSHALSVAADGWQTVPLPVGNRFPRVELTYREEGPPLRCWRRLAVQMPDVNVPVLDRRWSVWLPPSYRPVGMWSDRAQSFDPAPRWTQRLLGPLAADSAPSPLRLFARDDALAVGTWADRSRAGAGAEQVVLWALGELLQVAAADPRREQITWRELFQRYAGRPADAAGVTDFWVDASWLAAEGFALDHTLPPWAAGSPGEAACALLSAEHLVLVVHGDRLLLTSREGLARYPAMWESTTDLCVVVARLGERLARDLDSVHDGAIPGVVPLSTWVSTPGALGSPWAGQRDGTRSGIASRAGRMCRLTVDHAGRGTLTVEHVPTLQVVGWSLLLAGAGIVGSWGRHLRRHRYLLLAAAAIVALAAPPALVPITSCLCPGILAGLVIAWLRGGRAASEPAPEAVLGDRAVAVRAGVATPVLLAAGLLWGGGVEAAAQEVPAGGPGGAGDRVYEVVVPVDSALAPVGQYDYLPAELYDALHLRAGPQNGARDAWFLRRATYRAVFNWRQQRSALDLTTMTAAYELDVVHSSGRLDFPWDGLTSSVALLEAHLDDQPVEPTWNAAKSAFSIRVPGPGTFRLELVLRPAVREEPGQRSLRFAVPPVARARLLVESPFGAPDVQAPSAVGSSQIDPGSGRPLVELGPTKELWLRWPSGAAESASPQPMDVQQLMWLKVDPKSQPDAVVLEARLRVQAPARPIEEIQLHVDSRLRWMAEPDAPAYEWSEEPTSDPGEVVATMRLHAPITNQAILPLRFHMTDTTGLGNVSLPRLECVSGRTTRRALAVSVAPDVEFTAGMSDVFTPLDAAEFLTLWGETDSAPNLCYGVPADDPGWSLATRLRPPRSESRQEVTLSFGASGVHITLDAEINTDDGEEYQHRLTVPREFRVDSVRVTAEQADVAKEVAYDGTGALTVFLRRGVAGRHRLILRGHQLWTDIGAPLHLPQVTLTDTVVRSQTVRLYRRSDVWMEVQTPPGLTLAAPTPEDAFDELLGRHVATWELSDEGLGSAAGVTVQLHPNEPRFTARLVTRLQRAGDQWEATADFEARVADDSGGCVDQFRFEVPPEWSMTPESSDRVTFEPDLPHTIREVPGQRPQLIVWPPSPITDQFQLHLRFPVELGAAERGRTPNIVPLDASNTERFFLLPTLFDEQRVEWETPGLVEVPLSDVQPQDAADTTGQLAYRVWSKPRVAIADVQRVSGQRRVSLADVLVDCQADGSCYGVVTFAIEPAGTAQCTLDVPPGCELVHASIDGVPAVLLPLANRRWQLQLASKQLPQQLAVTFRGERAEPWTARTRALAVPWVSESDVDRRLAVDRTLWTIRGPAGGVLQIADAAQHALSAAEQESRRLRVAAGLVASAADTVLGSPPRDVQAWYTPWATRIACAAARIASTRWSAPPDAREIDSGTLDSVCQEQRAIAQRLKASSTVEELVQQTNCQAQTNDVWYLSGPPTAAVSHYDFDAQVPQVQLRWYPDRQGTGWPRLWAAALLAVCGAALHTLEKRGVLLGGRFRWPSVLGVLAGIGWWLIAWPGILGWAIVAVSLWGAIRPRAGAGSGL